MARRTYDLSRTTYLSSWHRPTFSVLTHLGYDEIRPAYASSRRRQETLSVLRAKLTRPDRTMESGDDDPDGREVAEALYGGPEKATDTIDAGEAQDLFDYSRSEEELHRACVRWADAQAGAMPELDALFHPPNGGARTAKEGSRMKKMGVKPGVPDLCLPIVRPVTWTGGDTVPAGALWIELKSKNGRLRDTQKTWRARLLKHQHCWTLCRSLEGFRAAVTDYVAGDWTQPPIEEMED